MKYRIDFVTNSSSSSSVVVKLSSKDKSIKEIYYDIGWSTIGFYHDSSSYDIIHKNLCVAMQLEIINTHVLELNGRRQITDVDYGYVDGANDIVLNEKNLKNYVNENAKLPVSKKILELLEIERIKNIETPLTYEEFMDSSIWKVMEIEDPKIISIIEEEDKIGCDIPSTTFTKVNLKTLDVEQNEIYEDYDYDDNDFDE